MATHLGDLLRRSLRASDQPEFALSDELEVLRAYLAIVSARFGDRVHVDLQVDPAAHHHQIALNFPQPSHAGHESPALESMSLEEVQAGTVRGKDCHCQHFDSQRRRVTNRFAQKKCA